jgi:hypothetical protein
MYNIKAQATIARPRDHDHRHRNCIPRHHYRNMHLTPPPIPSMKKPPSHIYSKIVFNKTNLKNRNFRQVFTNYNNFYTYKHCILCRKKPSDDKITSNGSIAPCSLVMKHFVIKRTPDDGHKRPKRVGILCF